MLEYEKPERLWECHKKKYSLKFGKTEEAERFNIFKSNLNSIEEHNQSDKGFKIGPNQFTHMSNDEYRKLLTLKVDDHEKYKDLIEIYEPEDVKAPGYLDYRDKHCVTDVKNQGSCGSCWAQCTIGCLEGFMAIKGGKLTSYSVQQLVDCCKNDCAGCGGGSILGAINFIISGSGIATDHEYPYVAKDQKCKPMKGGNAKFNKAIKLKEGDENGIAGLLAKYGPVCVGVDAGAQTFSHYKGGIYYEPPFPYRINHGVLCVGYGQENGVPYWIIKNSYGKEWGENGYMRLRRGHRDIGIGDYAAIGI